MGFWQSPWIQLLAAVATALPLGAIFWWAWHKLRLRPYPGAALVTTAVVGTPPATNPERTVLFIGQSTLGNGTVRPFGASTKPASIWGAGPLVDELTAFLGQKKQPGWSAYAISHGAAQNWQTVLDQALAAMPVPPELVAICAPVALQTDIGLLQAKADALLGQDIRLSFHVPFRGVDNTPVTGDADQAAYLAKFVVLTLNLTAPRVFVYPRLWGSELGAVMARMVGQPVHWATYRVASGAVSNPGAKPVDAAGRALDIATVRALAAARGSVLFWDSEIPGVYIGKCFPLGGVGDPLIAEDLRVVDMAARRVRTRAFAKLGQGVADRQSALDAFAADLAKPLRDMANGIDPVINPPADDAVVIERTDPNTMMLYVRVRPIGAVSDITAAIQLITE